MVALKSEVSLSHGCMTFVAPLADLKRATMLLSKVADRKSTMPILGMIAIRMMTDERVLLCATDLNVTATVRVDADINQERSTGGYCVPVKQLHDTLRHMTGQDVRFTLRDGALSISCGDMSSLIRGIPDREFPKVPDDRDVAWTTCDGAPLADMFEATLPSVCSDETRFHLNGVLYECPTGTYARMVSTDGHRLTKVERPITGALTPASGVIILRKGVVAIMAALASGKRATKSAHVADMAWLDKGRMILVRSGDVTVASKTIDAQFPPYEQVIPSEYKLVATVDRKSLIASMKRAKIACSETRGARLTLTERKLTIASDDPDTGSAQESLAAAVVEQRSISDFSGKYEIGVNASYMLDALDAIDCKDVTLAFGGELDPILVRGTHDAVEYSPTRAPLLVVIMPMRI